MANIKQPTKIEITMHGIKYSVEAEHSNLTIMKIMEIIEGLLLSVGYSQNTIDEYFKRKH